MRHVLSILLPIICLSSCSKQVPPAPRLPVVILTTPVVQDVPLYLDYAGHVEAYKTIDVQSQIAGELTGMYFEEGTEVKEGEVLFTIDSRPYIAALDKAEASLAQSIASMKYAEETARRYSKLVQQEYVALLQYDQYLTNVLVEQASVEANEAEVETARLNLGYTTIYSPISAVAGKKQIDVGNYITPAENPSLIVLNQINPVFASFFAPDVDLPIIQKYQTSGELKAHVFLNQDTNHPFEGKLTLIDNQVDESTGTIFMKATLCNDNKELWPGEFIDIRIILTEIKDAILLPTQAIQLGQQGHFVFTVDQDNVTSVKKVKTGQIQKNMIVIEEGLSVTDRVVLEGQLNLYPGAKVIIQETDTVPTAPDNDSVTEVSSPKKLLGGYRSRPTLNLTDRSGS
ncbi:MAG: efflux RND transporter periplasmic adaptor subunit [Chlamydiae bacterium]|nr:efflux RND transporter periplasmic adaptor subunit [Chlamydiota bacterium]